MSDKNFIISVQCQNVRGTIYENGEEYICLTDIANKFGTQEHIKNWLQNKNTIEFLGVWEQLNNINFNLVEFHQIVNEAGSNRFIMSVKKWKEKTNAVGLIARAGQHNSGTYAQKDIALEFCSWLSPEFKLYLIKEFQRLKEQEIKNTNLDWNLSRFLSSVNYKIHTDAIKNHLLPTLNIDKVKEGYIYASEADLLNYALFNKTAKEWRLQNPQLAKQGNIRDFASVQELIVLSNLESSNARMTKEKIPQEERLKKLREQAVSELNSLLEVKKIPTKDTLFNKELNKDSFESLNNPNAEKDLERFALARPKKK